MKKIIGYTTGVFDLFHIGHLNILKRAKGMCDELIIGVTTDELAEKRKGKRPIIPFEERVEIVKSIKYVDLVVPQKEINELKDLEKLKFNIMFKGDDWKGTDRWNKLEKKFSEQGVKIIFLPYTKTTSSTLVRKVLYGKIEKDKKNTNNIIFRIHNEYCRLKNIFIQILRSNQIHNNVPKSTVFKHTGFGVAITKKAVIGENCIIGQNVTIGIRDKMASSKQKKEFVGAPIIEDNVRICANACVIGGIVVGHDSIIGAGATLTKNVPPYSLVVGNNIIYKGKYKNGR